MTGTSCPRRPAATTLSLPTSSPMPQPTTQTDNNSTLPPTTQQPVPTISGNEALSDQQISLGADVGLISGVAVTIVILSIAMTLIVTMLVIALLIHGKRRKSLATSVPTDTNQSDGVTIQNDMGKIDNEGVYSYPEVVFEVQTKSKAYDTTISTKRNMAYYYSTNMVIQENEAYATNIITETNEVNHPRTTVTVPVTTENHYIYENEPDYYYII